MISYLQGKIVWAPLMYTYVCTACVYLTRLHSTYFYVQRVPILIWRFFHVTIKFHVIVFRSQTEKHMHNVYATQAYIFIYVFSIMIVPDSYRWCIRRKGSRDERVCRVVSNLATHIYSIIPFIIDKCNINTWDVCILIQFPFFFVFRSFASRAPADDPQQVTLPNLAAQKKNSSRRNAWGNLSYADLITQAITSAVDNRLTLSQIYEWMVQNVPYFKDKGDSNSSAGWKVSSIHPIKTKKKSLETQNSNPILSNWNLINK